MRALASDALRAPPRLMELPVPIPGPQELQIRVEAAGVNPIDAKILNGLLEGRPHVFPVVAGVDGAGTVAQVGQSVSNFAVGDSVFGSFLHDPVGVGTYAEYSTALDGGAVAKIPPGLSAVEAAAVPTAGMAALASLEELDLPRGASLAVVGASGGVGSFATQLAAARGLRVVAIARSSSRERLLGYGVSETVDPEAGDVTDGLRRAVPDGLDGLLDLMSDRESFARLASFVRPGGAAASTRYVGPVAELPRRGVRAFDVDLQPSAALLGRLVDDLQRYRLRIPVARTVALSEAADALRAFTSGRSVGKVVIVPG